MRNMLPPELKKDNTILDFYIFIECQASLLGEGRGHHFNAKPVLSEKGGYK